MAIAGAHEKITQTVLCWTGVTAQPHRFGGTEYLLGTREIGHIHGDYLVDIPFPSKVRNEIVAAKSAEPHHLLSDSGWISFYIRESADIERVIALLERSYAIAYQQYQRRTVLEP
ncbi:DUF5519 family protein [soil metagenome]